MRFRRLLGRILFFGFGLAVTTGDPTSHAYAQSNGWTYDIFVSECVKAGGAVGSTREQYIRGEQFVCRRSSTGASGPPPGEKCAGEAKANIDWIMNGDRGAFATYAEARARGESPLDAAITAQAHDPHAQQTIIACADWVTAYIAPLDGANINPPQVTLADRALGQEDCRCISVLPTNDVDTGNRRKFHVKNKCDGMNVAVEFVEMQPDRAMSSWANAGALDAAHETDIRSPGTFSIASIDAITLKNARNSHVCLMTLPRQ